MLISVPLGGLCNRLRHMLSVISLATDTKAGVEFRWPCNAECFARFDQLFEPLSHTVGPALSRDLPGGKRDFYLRKTYRRLRGYRKQWRDNADAATLRQALMTDKGQKTYIASGYALTAYDTRLAAKMFVPLPHLQDRIAQVTAHFGTNTIGMHIRRTDNAQSMAHSPVECFERIAAQAVQEGKQIYLATDDEGVLEHFKQTFGQHLLHAPFVGGRDTLQGMEAAVTDLWSLAKTTHIYGSYYSSYSEMAAEIGQVPYTVVRKK